MGVPASLDDVVPRPTLDKVFFAYYVFQIVSTLGLDFQGTFSYPSWMRAIHTHHVETWKDPWLANTWKHPWYFAICIWEYSLHVPFYFVAAITYYRGVRSNKRIRIPVIMYCTQTMTAVSGVIMMALFEDFSNYTDPHPTNMAQRLALAFMYSIFFFFTLLNMADAIFSKDYVEDRGEDSRSCGSLPSEGKKEK